MANEFIARNGIFALSNSQVTGSLSVTNGITGSLFGTASRAVSASQALSASWAPAPTNTFLQNGNSFGTTASLGTNDNTPLYFETNGTTKMAITTGGSVGIGTTNPQGTIDVFGGDSRFGTGTNGYIIISDENVGGELGIMTNQDEVVAIKYSDGTFRYGGGGTVTAPIIVSQSNVGIGITNPIYTLDVSSPTARFGQNANGYVIISDDNYGGELGILTHQDEVIASQHSDGTFRYGGNNPGAEPLIVSASNVGIGTTTPNTKLDVNGNAIITGSLTVTGRITAEEFHTEFVSSSIIYLSGSTKFGDSLDDVMSVTGSLRVNGGITGSLFGTASNALTASNITPAITTGNTNNNVLTANGNGTLTGEANLTFDGTLLKVNGQFEQGSNDVDAIGSESHAEGKTTQAKGPWSHAEGYLTITDTNADVSHAEGWGTYTKGLATHAEGYYTSASGNYSHAEGSGSISSGISSHAEGHLTVASGSYSHAEGHYTTTQGYASHAEGVYTHALGDYSHAAGNYTSASGNYQSVIGQYNLPLTTPGAFIIGNGIGTGARSNLLYTSGSQVQVTGSVIATQGFTGSLFGTASWAVSASWAPATGTAATASFVTSSNVFGPNGSNSILSASFASTAGTATNATNVNITSQDTTPVTYNITFTGGTSGNNSLNVDSTTLTYNPSTGTFATPNISATSITASLQGTASWATNATNAVNVGVTDNPSSGGGPFYIPFVASSTGNAAIQVDSSTFLYAPSTNTITVTNLAGTASWATNVTTAQTASFVTGSNVFGPNGSNSILSASFAISSSRAVTSSFAVTSSNALTASFVTSSNVFGPNGSNSILSASFAISSSRTVTSSFAISSSNALTASFAISSSRAVTSSFAISSSNALTSSFAISSSRAVTSSFAISSSNALTSSFLGSTTNAFIQNGNSFGTTAVLGTNDNNPLALETNGTTRMFISSSGDVGIGTASPAVRLDVQTTGTVQTSILGRGSDGNFRLNTRQDVSANTDGSVIGELGIDYTTTRNSAIRFHRGGSTTGGFISFTTDAGSERVRINSTGNVGIQTTDPVDKLDVNGAIRFRLNTPNFTATPNSGVLDFVPTSIFPTDPQIRLAAVGTPTIGASIAFQTGINSGSLTERMRITPSGSVGINTTTPSRTLDVNGDSRLKGIIVGSTAPGAGQSGGNLTIAQYEPGTGGHNVFQFYTISNTDGDSFGQATLEIDPETGTAINQYNTAGTTGSAVTLTQSVLTLAGVGSTTIQHTSNRNNILKGGIDYDAGLNSSQVNGEMAYWGGGSVTAGNVYFYSSTGNWVLADADAAVSSSGMLGIAQATGTASTVGMLLRGQARFTGVTSFTGTTTVGAPLYVSQTAGAFTQTAPTGTGKVVRIIGYVQSTANDQIYFCPDTTWVELV